MIVDLQESDTWKIPLTIVNNFISSQGAEEEPVMHSKSDNTKFTLYNDANKVVNEFFELFRSIYRGHLEKSMRGSEIIFDSVQLMHYKCQKVNCRRGVSYIDSPDWRKKKKATLNSKNKDD